MFRSCVRCSTPASVRMAYDYAERQMWVEDLDGQTGPGSALCATHGERLSPPLGWTFTDRRSVVRLFSPLEVA